MIVIAILSQSGYNVVHWIFALRYWTLAHKIERMKQGKNPDKHN